MLGVNSTVICSKNALHFVQVTVQGSLEQTATTTGSMKMLNYFRIVTQEGHLSKDFSTCYYARMPPRTSPRVVPSRWSSSRKNRFSGLEDDETRTWQLHPGLWSLPSKELGEARLSTALWNNCFRAAQVHPPVAAADRIGSCWSVRAHTWALYYRRKRRRVAAYLSSRRELPQIRCPTRHRSDFFQP